MSDLFIFSLYIKNMVCPRCIRVVREELEKIGLTVKEVILGKAVVESAQPLNLTQIESTLHKAGFELLSDQKAKLAEQIKTLIIDLVHQRDEQLPVTYSHYLSEKLGRDYHYLSQLFSSLENVTIERYIILQKIERAKELLVYAELTLSEIAYQLHYSSVAHLSAQFKQVTGFTPTEFKKLKSPGRSGIDSVTKA